MTNYSYYSFLIFKSIRLVKNWVVYLFFLMTISCHFPYQFLLLYILIFLLDGTESFSWPSFLVLLANVPFIKHWQFLCCIFTQICPLYLLKQYFPCQGNPSVSDTGVLSRSMPSSHLLSCQNFKKYGLGSSFSVSSPPRDASVPCSSAAAPWI